MTFHLLAVDDLSNSENFRKKKQFLLVEQQPICGALSVNFSFKIGMVSKMGSSESLEQASICSTNCYVAIVNSSNLSN